MKKDKSTLGIKLLFFIIWPFGAFLHSFGKPQLRSSRIIFYLWFVLFGLCLLPINEKLDSYRYAQLFEWSKNMSVYTYQKNIKDFFYNRSSTDVKDLYGITTIFLVSRVTNNVHVLFMIFAIVFGLFYVKSMRYALSSFKGVLNNLIFIILFGWFCISNPIFNINGVRFWTAAWMGVYIMFRYLITKDYKVLLLLPFLFLVHASFILFVAVFLIYLFLGRYHKAWDVIFVISLFFSGMSFLPIISDYVMNYSPQNLQFMFQYYTNDDYMANKAERLAALSVYAQLFRNLPLVIINLVAAICLLKRKEITKNKLSNRILEFTIILLSLTNMFSVIPSIERYYNIVVPFLVYILISNLRFLEQVKWVVYLIPVMYTYPIYLWLLNMNAVTSLAIYLTPLPFHLISYLFI